MNLGIVKELVSKVFIEGIRLIHELGQGTLDLGGMIQFPLCEVK